MADGWLGRVCHVVVISEAQRSCVGMFVTEARETRFIGNV